jgi:hypothetical protein
VIGRVEIPATPGVAEVVGDHDLRTVPADHRTDRSAEGYPVLEYAVGKTEKLDHVDPDDPGGGDLLGLADPP